MATIVPSTLTPTIGTPTQNTSGYPEIILVTGSYSSTTPAALQAFCDASATPTPQVASTSMWNSGIAVSATVAFVVQPGYYWKVTGPSSLIATWVWQLQSGAVNDPGDLAGSRAVGTVYQNTTGNAIFLLPQLTGVVAGNITNVYHDPSSPPSNAVWQKLPQVSGTDTPFVIVPNGHYYKVTGTGASVLHWREYQLPFQATRTDVTASRSIVTVFQNTTAESVWEVPILTASPIGTTILRIDTVNPPLVTETAFSDNGSAASETVPGFVGSNYYFKFFRDTGLETLSKCWEYSFVNASLGGIPIVQFVNP